MGELVEVDWLVVFVVPGFQEVGALVVDGGGEDDAVAGGGAVGVGEGSYCFNLGLVVVGLVVARVWEAHSSPSQSCPGRDAGEVAKRYQNATAIAERRTATAMPIDQ